MLENEKITQETFLLADHTQPPHRLFYEMWGKWVEYPVKTVTCSRDPVFNLKGQSGRGLCIQCIRKNYV